VNPEDPPPAIELRGLGRRYGERTVLREVTLALAPGATLCVLGHNGAGKTTLLRILATLIRPHHGDAEVLGEPLPRNAYKVRSKIGLVAHEPLLYADLSGRENLRYHARLHGVGEARIDELLERTQMSERAGDPVRTLSKGMTQRLAVCRAVLHDPAVLLLDEPRANLDPGAAAMLEPLIGRDSGRTRVLTSHDPEAALAESDLALGLDDGRPVFVAAAGEVLAKGLHKGLYAK
jgi:heme exporter protein A